MARSFEIDMRPLKRLIAQSPGAAGRGAKRGLDDVKDDWVRGARDIAPLDTSNLRRQISGKAAGGLNGSVIVTANATAKTGDRRFNYGYYIHEQDAGGKQLRTPGTVKKFLDKSADEAKWKRLIEDEMKAELRRSGW
ncbi:hypothetical protein [Peribacillus huizhouensis]|uniref:HK97 gp10 family phage protein n=1 Tax=Peribacillus huizhouensis TaxID=1501239 RepID=A0ABR6CR65_9BACI|nr:hypothetical protein [Peribacillus huizhouensis]MBA9027520.1 hypothetical protein [Peribacillus huizhouensis]